MSEYNGNGHANGNGKAFVLERPKSADEIQREGILRSMPELRRNCSKDPRLKKFVGAKWLFSQISDLTFLHAYGGDGFGKIYISIKDLQRIFGHDPHSLKKWRDKLIETGWIWCREMWPKSEWGIAGVCRQPDLFPIGSEYTRQLAKSGVKESHGPNGNGKSEDFLRNEGGSHLDSVKGTHTPREPFTLRMSTLHTHLGSPSPTFEGRVHTGHVKESVGTGVPVTSSEGSERLAPSEGSTQLRESPLGVRSSGAIKGADCPPQDGEGSEKTTKEELQLASWRESLSGSFPSHLVKTRDRLSRQRDNSTAPNVREFLGKKIKILNELLDGPVPAPIQEQPKAIARKAPSKPMTEAELLESARSAIALGAKNLTKGQREALVRAGELK